MVDPHDLGRAPARPAANTALDPHAATLARLLDAASFSATVAADGTVGLTHVSPHVAALTGLDAVACLREPLQAQHIIHPDDLSRVAASILESITHGSGWQCEFRVGSDQRGWRWLEGRAMCAVTEGSRRRYDGILVDITARRHLEDTLSDTTRTLQHAQTLARLRSWTADLRRGTFEVLDSGGPCFLGWPAGTYTADDFEDSTHPEDREEQQAAWRHSIETGKPFEFEHRAWVNGRLLWLRARADFERDADGHVVRAVGITQDITASRQAEDRVKRFVSGSPTVIYAWIVEPDGLRHSWTSDNVRQLTGHGTPATTDALWFAPYLHPEDAERVLAAHALPYDTNQQVIEYRLRRADGEYVWVRDEKRLRRDDQGQPAEIFGAWTDVTSRVVLEEQFHQAQKMEAIGRLAGGIAHDFNNLLTVICGTTDLLLLDMTEANAARPFVADIQRAATRAVSLTRQLLAFSRRQVLNPRTLDLNDIVQNVEGILRRLIGEDVHIVTALASDPVTVHVDPGQMEQVLLNLAVNARDAMPQGGTLRIETGHFEMTPEFCRTHPGSRPGSCSVLSLTDTGTGMTPDVRARLFEPFFTTKAPGRGTGLGLSMVFGVIKQSDGYVDVWSEEARGTRISIYLPRVARPATAPDRERDRQAASRGHETLLLVEDEDSVRRLTRRALENFGYQVLEASGGEEALALARARGGQIDLLITDVVMPGMSGAQLAERLAAEYPHLRVLFVSSYIDDEIVRHGVVEGSHSFLQKPFMPAVLAGKVRGILDRG